MVDEEDADVYDASDDGISDVVDHEEELNEDNFDYDDDDVNDFDDRMKEAYGICGDDEHGRDR